MKKLNKKSATVRIPPYILRDLYRCRCNLVIIIFLLMGTVAAQAQQKQLPQVNGSIKISGLQMQQTGNLLCLTFQVAVNEEAMNYRQSWSIIPELIAVDGIRNVLFPTLLINGRKKEHHLKRKLNFQNIKLYMLQTNRTKEES